MRDLIDRRELLEALGFEESKLDLVKPGSTFDVILSLCAIDAEPVRHGTWVYDSFTEYRCCICNSPAPQYGYKKTYVAKTDYCPNCGAKMDERTVSDDGQTT